MTDYGDCVKGMVFSFPKVRFAWEQACWIIFGILVSPCSPLQPFNSRTADSMSLVTQVADPEDFRC